jgi:hypothetical protein
MSEVLITDGVHIRPSLNLAPVPIGAVSPIEVSDIHLIPAYAMDESSLWTYLVAEFHDDREPTIHGGAGPKDGCTLPKDVRNKAVMFAAYCNAPGLDRAVVCERIGDNGPPRWRSPDGRIVLLKHCQPPRKIG